MSIKKMLTGIDFPSEYLWQADGECDGVQVEIRPAGAGSGYDVTKEHVLLGATPAITGIRIPGVKDHSFQKAQMNFSFGQHKLGSIALEKMDSDIGDGTLTLFKGIGGENKLLHPFHMFIQHLRHDNPGISWQQYQMIRLLYAVPRKVSLISFAENNTCNFIPADLHGPVNDRVYAISLRAGSKALAQIKTIGKIALCDMAPASYSYVKAQGKNHMQDMMPSENILRYTGTFKIPIPEDAVAYTEMELESTYLLGAYELLLFKTGQREILQNQKALVTVHSFYAAWFLNHIENIEHMGPES